MSRRWIQNLTRCADEYLDGIENFIEFARTHNPDRINFQKQRDCPDPSSSFVSFFSLSAVSCLIVSPLLLRKKDRAATTFEAYTFPAIAVASTAGIGPVFADSSPASFSLLQQPIPTPEMSNLIRSSKVVMTAQSSPFWTQLSSAATALTMMDHLPVGPGGPRRLRHRLHQWCNLLAPGGITAPSVPLTPHQPTLLVRRGHSQV
ncbi:hypothetical protein L3X38_033416 [Prunus dulcis]|uniref:Uncharacterized protein n=1 Tax=Prunus dulcis TaxID=3755 RepID=A0AAD4VH13_PRUDU|nr:hypothetical protein L3X38_033416 [Prunus dulcis]